MAGVKTSSLAMLKKLSLMKQEIGTIYSQCSLFIDTLDSICRTFPGIQVASPFPVMKQPYSQLSKMDGNVRPPPSPSMSEHVRQALRGHGGEEEQLTPKSDLPKKQFTKHESLPCLAELSQELKR